MRIPRRIQKLSTLGSMKRPTTHRNYNLVRRYYLRLARAEYLRQNSPLSSDLRSLARRFEQLQPDLKLVLDTSTMTIMARDSRGLEWSLEEFTPGSETYKLWKAIETAISV